MKKISALLCMWMMIATVAWSADPGWHLKQGAGPFPTLKDVTLTLPGELGDTTFYGADRWRWYSWDYFETNPFDNSYENQANQLRLGARLENPLMKAHAAWQYAQTWLLPSGTSAGAGSGSLYFANGTGRNETHGTYLKYAELALKDVTGLGLTAGGGRMDYSSGNRYATGTGKGSTPADLDLPVVKKIQWLKSSRIAERVIGGFGWSEFQRSFDGGYVAWDTESTNLQFAAMNPTQGGFDENAGRGMSDIDLMAAELIFKRDSVLKNTEWGLFYYQYADQRQMTALTVRRDNSGRSVAAGNEHNVKVDFVGGQMAGAQPLGDGAVDYLLWGGYQSGEWFELQQRAYAVAAEMGYQWNVLPWKPWLRVGYDAGSGDSDASDGRHGTFYQMLPTGRIYSSAILYNLMNTDDAFVSLILKPVEPLTLRSDAHWVGLDSSSDRWYLGSGEITDGNAAGYASRSGGGADDLGTLWDLNITYKLNPQAALSVYYGHFFGSTAVENFYTQKNDCDLLYTEVALTF